MRSIWESKIYLSKEVLWVSVGQLASKLQPVKVRALKKILLRGTSRVRVAQGWLSGRIFFYLKLWQPVALLPFDLQRLTVPLWKDLDHVVIIVSAQKTDSISKKNFALSKWLNIHRAQLLGVSHSLRKLYQL